MRKGASIICELCGKKITSYWADTPKFEVRHNPLCAFWNTGDEEEDTDKDLKEEYDLAN